MQQCKGPQKLKAADFWEEIIYFYKEKLMKNQMR